MRFTLLWKRTEEKAFTTDVSLGGMFIRTAAVPPQGSQVELILPEALPLDECVRIEATVVRVVQRGDPANPLGGIAVTLDRIKSLRGTGPVIEMLTTLLGDQAPEIAVKTTPVIVELPAGHIRPLLEPDAEADAEIEEIGFDGVAPLTTEMAVFCRINNMVMRATLLKLGTEQAILGNIRVAPEEGAPVSVRLISSTETLFRGVEFTGTVDQVMKPEGETDVFVSVAIDPIGDQKDRGSLTNVLKQLSGANLTGSGSNSDI